MEAITIIGASVIRRHSLSCSTALIVYIPGYTTVHQKDYSMSFVPHTPIASGVTLNFQRRLFVVMITHSRYTEGVVAEAEASCFLHRLYISDVFRGGLRI